LSDEAVIQTLYRWSRRVKPEADDVWETTLVMAGIADYAMSRQAGQATTLVEVFFQDRAQAEEWKASHGGRLDDVSVGDDLPDPRPEPIKIRDRFLITAELDSAELAELEKASTPGDQRRVIQIPCQRAFGTGDHPTTATSLRFLCDLASKAPEPWSCLDLGTGSGVLAIAARHLGSNRVLGMDNDPVALRIAGENAERNQASGIVWEEGDVFKWSPSSPSWDVIVANIFADILCPVMPRIASWLAPGGSLVLSGIMRAHEAQVREAVGEQSLEIAEIRRVGKWCTLVVS